MIRSGQGPQNDALLLIGSGRLARHLHFYLEDSTTKFLTWSRRENSEQDLHTKLRQSRAVALAISDHALGGFADRFLKDFTGPKLHFSGAWHRDDLWAAHPLMSFGPELYPKEFYPKIHFTLTGFESLQQVFPHWTNPTTLIEAKDKARYHALCVLGGNFPVLLWHKMETDLKALQIPEESIRLYIERVSQNYLSLGQNALTGPLIRKDEQTIQQNLQALADDPWQGVYQAFREVNREPS